ncbi:MAG: GTPase HflX [Bacteroidetes bacterium]|nr:GTPase HflX [Bacteroidota bacterium]
MRKLIDIVQSTRERAIAVGVATYHNPIKVVKEHLEELALLADTAGADIIKNVIQERDKFDTATYVGKGKVAEIKKIADEENIQLIIIDDDLSPGQASNLEKELEIKVIDRSGLILDIFAKRARSSESRTQVELAQLEYLLPRLTRLWTHLSKQFGGIGTKGPGETQIETDRRLARERISILKKKLVQIKAQRSTQRKRRADKIKVALVGYTNAGKSTLLNALSNADVFVENRLFATLDTTTRSVKLEPNRVILLTDTVGFIRKLPHHLVASFQSTLEEVREADIVLHVIDSANEQAVDQITTVNETLHDLEIYKKPLIYIFNKIDKMDDRSLLKEFQRTYSPSISISASRSINLNALQKMIADSINSTFTEVIIHIPLNEQNILGKIYSLAQITNQKYTEEKIILSAKIANDQIKRVRNLLALHKNIILDF